MRQIIFGLMGFILLSCAASNTGTTKKSTGRDYSNYRTLAEALRAHGAIVKESGNSASVVLRGKGSILLNTEPLYVLDGVPMGNDYTTVNNSINMMNVQSIRIIRSASQATMRYGEAANHGAIEIRTKANQSDQ